ncbi:response regulator [Syntrophus aciditrophicus]|nr:response regulator [Syntrophus aciditrophicus]
MMEEGKTLFNEVASGSYDASDRPFDFVTEQGETALVCESDPGLKDKTGQALFSLGYSVKEAESVRDALKKMRFHVFDVIVVNADFDEGKGARELLTALELLDVSIRRRIFVTLVGDSFRTRDSMAAFHRSVNLVVHTGDLNELGTIVKNGVQENKAFYHTYMEALRKMGRS